MRVFLVFKELIIKARSVMKNYFFIAITCLWFPLDLTADDALVDPTRPIQQSERLSGKQQYTLNAIFIANDRRHVVINGHQIREGGHSGALKVIRIRNNDVVVLIDGEKKTLRLHHLMRKNVNEIVKEKGAVRDVDKKPEMVVR